MLFYVILALNPSTHHPDVTIMPWKSSSTYTDTIYKNNSILRFDFSNWKNIQAHISQHIDFYTALNDEEDINIAIT